MFSSLRGMGGALLRDFETVMGSTLTADTPSHIHNPQVPLAKQYASRAVKCGQLTRLGTQVSTCSSYGRASFYSRLQRQQQYFAVLYPCTRLYLFADEDDWQARDCVDLDKADSLIIRRPDGSKTHNRPFSIHYSWKIATNQATKLAGIGLRFVMRTILRLSLSSKPTQPKSRRSGSPAWCTRHTAEFEWRNSSWRPMCDW